MKLLNETQSKWDKKIQIEISLRELQELYCALGVTNYEETKDLWKRLRYTVEAKINNEECPFDSNSIVCDDLRDILKELGGKTIV